MHNCQCQVTFYLVHTLSSEVPSWPPDSPECIRPPPAPNASLLSSGYQQLRIYQNPFSTRFLAVGP